MMRNTLTILLCVCASFFLRAQEQHGPVLKFTKYHYHINSVFEGDVAEYKFRFVNAGDQPLIITAVNQGMVGPDSYPKEPIAPGDSGFVIIRYMTAGKSGNFQLPVTVKSNNRGGDIPLFLSGYIFPRPAPDAPIMKFDSTTFWFDTITQGTIVTHEYRFTNKGKSPLIITDVPTGCGCLVAEYPKEPIPPGGVGVIKLTFNSTGKAGMQDKAPTVNSNNGQGAVVIHIRGYVRVPPGKYPGPTPAPTNK
jgi:hypothetical protein